jgi:hypothetical protein
MMCSTPLYTAKPPPAANIDNATISAQKYATLP